MKEVKSILDTTRNPQLLNADDAACQMADLKPLAFEVEAQAIARSVLPHEDPRILDH